MATIYDVAEEAGVSTATVSRVMNGANNVRSGIRERVIAVATARGYSPSVAARNLRRGGGKKSEALTYEIGLIDFRPSPFGRDPFSAELVNAVEGALRECSYRMRPIFASVEGSLPADIAAGEVDGVISRASAPILRQIAMKVPVVCVDFHDPSIEAYAFAPDYVAAIKEASARLLAAGHRRIGLLVDDPEVPEPIPFAVNLVKGCTEAYREAGLPVPRDLWRGGASDHKAGYEVGCRIFRDPASRPDALIGSDGAMLGLYRAAAERGVRIPGDVSVIGVNGLPFTEYLYPPLTTLDMDIPAIARKATALLTDCIASGERRRGHEITPVVLRERGSARL
jgi:LacI family transcriptional regulator